MSKEQRNSVLCYHYRYESRIEKYIHKYFKVTKNSGLTFKTKLVTHLFLLNSHTNVWNKFVIRYCIGRGRGSEAGFCYFYWCVSEFSYSGQYARKTHLPRVLFHGQESVISPTESIISKNEQENLQFFSSTRNCKQVNHDREQSEEQTKICYSRL